MGMLAFGSQQRKTRPEERREETENKRRLGEMGG